MAGQTKYKQAAPRRACQANTHVFNPCCNRGEYLQQLHTHFSQVLLISILISDDRLSIHKGLGYPSLT